MNRSIRTAVLGALILISPAIFAQVPALPEPELDELQSDVVITEVPTFEVSVLSLTASEAAATLSALWFLDPGAPFEALPFEAIASLAQAGPASDAGNTSMTEAELTGLRNNEFFKESLRLKALALEAFEYGDYDASANYAAEAARAALRSDEYVAMQLKRKAAGDGIAAARERLDWAASIGAERRFAQAFSDASSSYQDAVSAYSMEEWDASIEASRRVVALLADVSDTPALPARYTVRSWKEFRDCFWNIAGYPFVYGDSTQWRRLYEANKAKLRRPDNPDLLHIGTVLDIPSIRGEVREGMWTKDRAYAPLPKRK